MSLSKILYRDLVHAAKQFDKHASLRALLSSNLLQRPVIHDTNTRLPHIENFNRCVLEYLENRSFYVPSAGKKSLATLVREKYRMAPSAADRMQVDTAFVALKALNDKLAEAQELGVVGYAATTKKSVEGVVSAQQEPNPLVADVQLAEGLAPGIFLLSHPLLSGIFNRSVIVLTEHSHSGAKGFIVNQPTTNPLIKAFKVHPSIMRAFGSSKVRTGGPVRTEYAEVLHSRADLGGQRIVTTNFHDPEDVTLFMGVDLESAAKAVDENLAKQSDIMFLSGISTWTAGQLENEMKRGTWVAVKAPVSLARY
uniref:Uncharacterized protein n=1 Tax=Globisporangium ultimum (strain ATCC 200006 / CBS 805.95 / DAOM BR144) TaxID=431595 RepID=K3WMC2_GLOUD